MSTRIFIEDDGDEVVYIKVNEEVIAEVDHGAYGWYGMEQAIKLVETLAETFDIPIINTQDIV